MGGCIRREDRQRYLANLALKFSEYVTLPARRHGSGRHCRWTRPPTTLDGRQGIRSNRHRWNAVRRYRVRGVGRAVAHKYQRDQPSHGLDARLQGNGVVVHSSKANELCRSAPRCCSTIADAQNEFPVDAQLPKGDPDRCTQNHQDWSCLHFNNTEDPVDGKMAA